MTYDPTELRQLIDSLLNETISAEDHQRLQHILRNSNEARREYLSSIDIHVGMYELEEDLNEVLVPPPVQCGPIPIANRPAGGRHWHLVLASLATLLMIIVSTMLLWRQPTHGIAPISPLQTAQRDDSPAGSRSDPLPDERKPSVAFLTKAASAELLLEYVPAIGDPLKIDHEYVLVKGLMELTFENGATVSLKSPSVFTIRSSALMELKMGNCSVYAPETAAGFEVITPQSRIVDLGTRFNVVASETGTSDVQVAEGAVVVQPSEAADQKSMLLEGEAVRLTSTSPSPKPIPFREERFVSQFPDRVIAYKATEPVPGEGVEDLKSVTVQRGGREWTYLAEELTLVDVIHFSSYSITSNSACLGELPEKLTLLLTNNYELTSGLTNFSRPNKPYVPANDFTEFTGRYGMAVKFHHPVINGPGPDVVVFELQSAAYPASGDPFYVSPIENGPGLKTHHVTRFDVPLNSINALKVAPVSSIVFDKPVRSLQDLTPENVVRVSKLNMPFYALAVGIDLSDLGYPEGAAVDGLFFEDADDDEHVIVDIVLIGGLPEVPPLR